MRAIERVGAIPQLNPRRVAPREPRGLDLQADELGAGAVVLVPVLLEPVGQRQPRRVLLRVRENR
jgi:hypothetical protein